MSTILIVEDDVNINEMLKVALQKEGYSCIQAFSGTEGRLVLSQEEPDLVLLDLMLPGMSGETLLEEIRQTKRAVPVIVLSARDEMDSKVDMLLSGADDYVVKPFEIWEVLARVQVQLRKRTGQEEKKVLEHNGLLLDTEEHQIYVDGVRLEGITRQEFLILQLFLRWPKKVFSKEEIFEAAWEEPFMGETKAIDVHISNIRKKMKAISERSFIDTVWGIGYTLSR